MCVFRGGGVSERESCYKVRETKSERLCAWRASLFFFFFLKRDMALHRPY